MHTSTRKQVDRCKDDPLLPGTCIVQAVARDGLASMLQGLQPSLLLTKVAVPPTGFPLGPASARPHWLAKPCFSI